MHSHCKTAKQSQPTYHYRLASNKTNVFRDDFLLTLLANEGEPNDIGVKGLIFACGAASFPPPVYDLIKTREKTIEASAHETTLPAMNNCRRIWIWNLRDLLSKTDGISNMLLRNSFLVGNRDETAISA